MNVQIVFIVNHCVYTCCRGVKQHFLEGENFVNVRKTYA